MRRIQSSEAEKTAQISYSMRPKISWISLGGGDFDAVICRTGEQKKKRFWKGFLMSLDSCLAYHSQRPKATFVCILRFSKATPAPNRRIELIRQPLYYPTRWIDAGWYTLLFFPFFLSPFPPPLRGIYLQLGIVARAECDLQSYPFQMTFPSSSSLFFSRLPTLLFSERGREWGYILLSFFPRLTGAGMGWTFTIIFLVENYQGKKGGNLCGFTFKLDFFRCKKTGKCDVWVGFCCV